MENKIKGAWLIHHSEKIQNVANASVDYEQINFSGKCGVLLSSITEDSQSLLDKKRVEGLARASGINLRLELPEILKELENQKLISLGTDEIEVLGLTSGSVLEHTSNIFIEASPSKHEIVALELAESSSDLPILEGTATEYIADTYRLTKKDSKHAIESAEAIGFVDYEDSSNGDRLIFNGNLFRKNDANKIAIVINTLKPSDMQSINELNSILNSRGCISLQTAQKITGEALFKKVHSIGLYDVSQIGNEQGNFAFITKPSAFSKFTNSIADDAFDLAKAFVTSLTYGMTRSQHGRGHISMIGALMRKLINGHWVGPATAIGQDYQMLESKGVIQVRVEKSGLYSMKLLKKEVGRLALKVILEGDISADSLRVLPNASISSYTPPEPIRHYTRKNQSPKLKHNIGDILTQLRTGNI